MGFFTNLIKDDVASAKLKYEHAADDLLKHYEMSKKIANIFGPMASMGVGIGKEIADWTGITGSTTGFSMDDLKADWAGATGKTLDEAWRGGMLTRSGNGK